MMKNEQLYQGCHQASVTKYDEDDDQWNRAAIIALPSPQDVDIKNVHLTMFIG